MFCYQHTFTSQCQEVTSEVFTNLIISDAVVNRIKEYRRQLPELEKLLDRIKQAQTEMDAIKSRDALQALVEAGSEQRQAELKKEIKSLQEQARKIKSIKTGLPMMIYQATFEQSQSAKGYTGYWRKQSKCILNGLFMLDVDHVENPHELVTGWVNARLESEPTQTFEEKREKWAESLGILLVHVTPSGKGIRIVAKAREDVGNLADNQAWLSKELGVKNDEACKDASRCSFCPSFEDIIYINKEQLFTYSNENYNQRYCESYRSNHSQPISSCAKSGANNSNGTNGTGSMVTTGGIREGAQNQSENTGADTEVSVRRLEEGYHGVSYEKILETWFRLVAGGDPMHGDRHRLLYQAACDFRYICDFNADLLSKVLQVSKAGREMFEEGDGAEIDRIARDAIALSRWRSIPKRFKGVLDACGALRIEPSDGNSTPISATIDYDWWYQQLRGILPLSPGYDEAVKYLPEHHQLAGVLAAGAMFGTYLTRCWWEHFDGKDYRMSFLVYVIGGAASGKSFIVDLDRLIMAPMVAADKVGREWERQYKEEMKKRAASGSRTKGEAPTQQHPVIRYVPSSISNAMLYRRLTDAVDDKVFGPDGQAMHLHCYTLEPELATALRAQQGSWAGKNDIELKSFHNEFAGVDFANDQSVNGVVQINWNQVVSGTQEAMSRKIKPSTVLDGLVTRLALYVMPSNDFRMIERRKAVRDEKRDAYLRSIGLKLDQLSGEIRVPKLVDFCYKYEEDLTNEARIENDYCLDYFRKRIPVIMMRYTIVKIVLREIDKMLEGNDPVVREDDLQFAKLIGDWCLNAQIHMFGEMVMQAQARERDSFVPRKRHSKVREMYASLPEMVSTNTLVDSGYCNDVNSASTTLRRWLSDGLLLKVDNHWYKKKYTEIPM